MRIVRHNSYWWNRTGKAAADAKNDEQTAVLDEHGDAELRLNVQDQFGDMKNSRYERFRDLEFRALVSRARFQSTALG